MRIPAVIILDTAPFSNSVVPFARSGKNPTPSQQCRQWLMDCEHAGAFLIVPAIAYYESLRELERRKAAGKIMRLKDFTFRVPSRFMPLTTAHLEEAARLWALARNFGAPNASDAALDSDVILVAQALSLGLPESDFIVATSNPRHLSRFVPCDEWSNLTP